MKACLLLLLLVLVAPWLTPHDPYRSLTQPWQAPDVVFWLGTDGLGRDVLSRVMNGGWSLLLFPFASTLLASLLGGIVGLLLLGLPGRGRQLVTVLDTLLFLPPLLAMMLVLYALGPGRFSAFVGIMVLNVPFTVRYVRALADPMLDSRYVEVACAAGDPFWLVLWRELMPGLTAGICADIGTRLVGAIYLISAASFLGIGTLSNGSDWASMVRDGLLGMALNPYATVLPATCISVVVVAINLTAQRKVQP